ncbi:MAG: hydroxyethylthiazole kinase [Motiliproteus sp.]|nr:hydroxyethylthiazole kinase [Motiliproteus sp.]
MSSAFNIIPSSQQGRVVSEAANSAAQALSRMAETGPRVQCITNPVAMDFSSDILLAVGAQSSMTLGSEEIAEFVTHADSLSVNIGTLDATRRDAINIATDTAADYQKRWVLDPVSVHASTHRCNFALDLIERRPSVIRGNYAEIQALTGHDGANGAQRLAREYGAVVVQSGETDLVTDGQRTLLLANGDAMQTRVSAMGCASTALLGGFLAVTEDPFEAAIQALLVLGVAAEEAVLMSAGPGSFQMHLLDRLYRMDEATLQRRGQLVWCEAKR